MKKLWALVLSGLMVNAWAAGTAGSVVKAQPIVRWTAVFSDVQPNQAGVTEAYCLLHTPTVMVTTIQQITSDQGVEALNGVWVRYLSYTTTEKDGLYFNWVKATVSGVDSDGEHWQEPMRLYEQTLSPTGVTNTVWSTPLCKGKFVGAATVTLAAVS